MRIMPRTIMQVSCTGRTGIAAYTLGSPFIQGALCGCFGGAVGILSCVECLLISQWLWDEWLQLLVLLEDLMCSIDLFSEYFGHKDIPNII